MVKDHQRASDIQLHKFQKLNLFYLEEYFYNFRQQEILVDIVLLMTAFFLIAATEVGKNWMLKGLFPVPEQPMLPVQSNKIKLSYILEQLVEVSWPLMIFISLTYESSLHLGL